MILPDDLVDANVLLDVWNPDPAWHGWSSRQMRKLSILHALAINSIIYGEVSVSFATPGALDAALDAIGIALQDIPREAAFMAGKAYVQYRRRGGVRTNVLPDFFLGAHAAVLGCAILTRDTSRYSTYFPSVRLIAP